MARRKRKSLDNPQNFLGLLIAVCVIWVIVQFIHLLQEPAVAVGALFGVLLLLAVPVILVLWRKADSRALLQKIEAITREHSNALVTRRAQLVVQDAYGRPRLEKWEKEIEHFITHVIQPSLNDTQASKLIRQRAFVHNHIDTLVEMAAQNQTISSPSFSDQMTPMEFEHYCAAELRRTGWNARVTLQSRDQGTDVVAEKAGIRIVLQCKLYARPVGNKAVQEVTAARSHERAHYGIVVSNASYTSAAQQLASTNNVLLLHYCDLQNLDRFLTATQTR